MRSVWEDKSAVYVGWADREDSMTRCASRSEMKDSEKVTSNCSSQVVSGRGRGRDSGKGQGKRT